MSELATLLSELESRWKQKGSDDYTTMAPGLDRAEVVRTLEAHGLRAPGELVDWFSWHNGVDREKAGSRWVLLAPTAFQQFSLIECLEERESWLQLAPRAAAGIAEQYGETAVPEMLEPSFWWEPTWLPIARPAGGDQLVVDLASTSDSVPVLDVEWSDIDEFRRPRAESLTAFVRLLLAVPDAYWQWLPAEQRWVRDFAEFPMELRRTGLF